MARWLTTLLISCLFSINVFADTLAPMTLEDQWEKTHSLDAKTKWVLFSHHKVGGEWVKNSVDSLQLTPLAQHDLLYVADISAMPGLITRMFALPKMRDYAFSIALVRESELVDDWPRQEDHVALIELKSLQVKTVHHFADEASLAAHLSKVFQADQRPASEN